jgi:hypothetical protein
MRETAVFLGVRPTALDYSRRRGGERLAALSLDPVNVLERSRTMTDGESRSLALGDRPRQATPSSARRTRSSLDNGARSDAVQPPSIAPEGAASMNQAYRAIVLLAVAISIYTIATASAGLPERLASRRGDVLAWMLFQHAVALALVGAARLVRNRGIVWVSATIIGGHAFFTVMGLAIAYAKGRRDAPWYLISSHVLYVAFVVNAGLRLSLVRSRTAEDRRRD